MKSALARVAGLALLFSAGLAGAATPLLVPLGGSGPEVKSAGDQPVRFNREGLERLAPGAEVELTLPDGSRHDYVFEQTISHGGGLATWIARSPLTGDSERAVITYGPQGAWGWMRTGHGSYRIYPSGRGHDLLAKRVPMSFAPKFGGGDAIPMGPDEPGIEALKGIPTVVPEPALKSFSTKVTPSPLLQSDVMFLYTRDLAEKLGVGLMPMLYNVIASLNQAYVDSEVAITLRLVNATMIDYANANSGDNSSLGTLNAMRGSGGNAAFFEPLTWGAGSIRDAVGADFVALLRDGPNDTGGIASLLFNPVTYPTSTATQTSAYSVNNFCAQGCEGLVAHEIGHNMGNHHDPATVAKDANGPVTATGVFPHSYGFYSCAGGLTCNPYTPGGCPSGYARCAGSDANDFGTVMSYFGPGIMKFSNPLLNNCVPAGGAAGSPRACGGSVPAPPAPATVSDNALSMNNVRGALSAYRNETIANLPGSLQFTATGYSGAEGGNLTFTVSRIGGTSGTVTVNYAVAAGSATAGADFTPTSGSLTWNPGDAADKTFNVALASDALVEGVETITATLSNLTGAPGVYLGYPTTVTGLIIEAWPVGTLGGIPTDPTGWASPASPVSSVPWAIVSDSAPAGDPGGRSLKSGAIDFSVGNRLCNDTAYGAVPCPSAVEITRNFSAGTVAYAYRVSSFPNNGFLEFLVDGTVVHSVSGVSSNTAADTGWQFFSTTIAAGNHTLRWQYRPRFFFACANASSDGITVTYPDCLDRAWIDQLALPANTSAASLVTLTVARDGSGAGSVAGTGIACPSDCQEAVAAGTVIVLTATSAAGSAFAAWSGCDSVTTNQCTVTVNADRTATATFTALTTYNLVLEGWQEVSPYVVTPATGTGTATFNTVTKALTLNLPYSGLTGTETAAHIHGPAARGANAGIVYTLGTGNPKNDTFTLTALQETQLLAGQLYVNIHTNNRPAGELRAQIDNLGATITRVLTVNKAGTGVGTVTGTAEPGQVVNCGSDCAETVPNGKVVALTATPAAGSTFNGWSGACTGTGACNVTMDAAKSVTATFSAVPSFTLTVAKAGTGTGTVASSPAGTINCGATCAANLVSGTVVQLVATPAAGSTFASWSGACTGTGACNVTMDAAKSVTATFNVDVPPDPPRLGNISTRMQVLTGNDVMIGGFVIGGSANKTVVVRARGPSLIPFGITNALANPQLQLVRSSDQGTIATNDDWQSAGNAAAITASGFAPGNDLEAAILTSLPPGAYTAIVSGVGGGTGVGIVEVFEVDGVLIPLANISTRGQVLTGNDVMIGGFVVQGDGPQTVVVRARGPSLIPFGITNALANPQLQLVRSADQVTIATNDDFGTASNLAQLNASGFAPSNALEAAILITLQPGAYTAIVTGAGGGTGVGIVEVFAVPGP